MLRRVRRIRMPAEKAAESFLAFFTIHRGHLAEHLTVKSVLIRSVFRIRSQVVGECFLMNDEVCNTGMDDFAFGSAERDDEFFGDVLPNAIVQPLARCCFVHVHRIEEGFARDSDHLEGMKPVGAATNVDVDLELEIADFKNHAVVNAGEAEGRDESLAGLFGPPNRVRCGWVKNVEDVVEVPEGDEVVEADVGASFVVEVEDGEGICPRPCGRVDEVECCAFAIDKTLQRKKISVVVEVSVRDVPSVVEEENVGNVGLFFVGEALQLFGWTQRESLSLFLALKVNPLASFEMRRRFLVVVVAEIFFHVVLDFILALFHFVLLKKRITGRMTLTTIF